MRMAAKIERPRKAGQPVHLYLDIKLYRAVKKRATADGRTITATIERLLSIGLHQRGEPT